MGVKEAEQIIILGEFKKLMGLIGSKYIEDETNLVNKSH